MSIQQTLLEKVGIDSLLVSNHGLLLLLFVFVCFGGVFLPSYSLQTMARLPQVNYTKPLKSNRVCTDLAK